MSAQISNKIFDPSNKISNAIDLMHIGHDLDMDHLLCAITLYGSGNIPKDATVEDAIEYYNAIGISDDDCGVCPCYRFCPVCKFYE